jgi:hypothetical protein
MRARLGCPPLPCGRGSVLSAPLQSRLCFVRSLTVAARIRWCCLTVPVCLGPRGLKPAALWVVLLFDD